MKCIEHKITGDGFAYFLNAPFLAAAEAPFFLADPALSSILRLFWFAVGEGRT